MAVDPRATISSSRMSRYQIIAVALCVLLAGLDGFDTLCIAYTAPAISREWGLTPASFGIVLSAALAGMGVGSIAISPFADKIGRRRISLLSLLVLVVGMLLCAFSRDVAELAAARAFTGLGIGSTLANLNVLVAEYSSDKRREFAISLMTIGYPVGAALGGAISIYLISAFGWRSVFAFGSFVALLLIPLAVVWLPELVQFLIVRRPAKALIAVNRILSRMGHAPVNELPQVAPEHTATSALQIVRPPYLGATVAICIAYLCAMSTVYFLLSWTPKILTELGFSISAGISGSLLMNLAGVIGCLVFGAYARKVGVRVLAAVFIGGLSIATVWFGLIAPGSALLLVSTAFIGFCLFTAVTALYVLTPPSFPTELRATGTGLAMAIGRIGAFAGPLLAGLLIGQGWSRLSYCLAMGAPALVAVICVRWMGTDAVSAARYASTRSDGEDVPGRHFVRS